MLFHSPEFIFAFFPATLACWFLTARWFGPGAARLWLLFASLFFYAWWDVRYVPIILGSIIVNFAVGEAIRAYRERPGGERTASRLVALGVGANIALLFWFKYAGFATAELDRLFGADLPLLHIALPLAISFFTFQQIAYLVDLRRGAIGAIGFGRYALCVVFFPHLIAGPIVHYRDLEAQFGQRWIFRPNARHIAVGLTLFVGGLLKKTVLADGVAPFADTVFATAAAGHAVRPEVAWIGALAYTLQIYFDFSGYSDMAVGLARCFGIRLPINFDSPYQSRNIVEFWRRWHMTLSAFLRDYLYIPLGGSRRGTARRNINILITMLLGGFWHGAGWTFLCWGGLHGAYIVACHTWQRYRSPKRPGGRFARLAAQLVTLLAIIVAWVFFRASSFDAAFAILKGMAGIDPLMRLFGAEAGIPAPSTTGFSGRWAWRWIAGLSLVALFAPNLYALVTGRQSRTVVEAWRRDWPARVQGLMPPAWRPSAWWAVAAGLGTALAVLAVTFRQSPFLYFQF